MKILIFLHGTAIMHKNAVGRSREERVKQSAEREESGLDYTSYVPVGNAVQKLKQWEAQGAEIAYLSSHIDEKDIRKDKLVLEKYGFPRGMVYFRQNGETYADVAERIMPDIIIEDDCESIGGEKEMTYPHIKPGLKSKVMSIVVKEFQGIDHLPDNPAKLSPA